MQRELSGDLQAGLRRMNQHDWSIRASCQAGVQENTPGHDVQHVSDRLGAAQFPLILRERERELSWQLQL